MKYGVPAGVAEFHPDDVADFDAGFRIRIELDFEAAVAAAPAEAGNRADLLIAAVNRVAQYRRRPTIAQFAVTSDVAGGVD